MLYPHFQKAVVPGWLDKGLAWRHGATPFLDSMMVLAPDPDWVRSAARTASCRTAPTSRATAPTWPARMQRLERRGSGRAQQLAEEFAQWLERPDRARRALDLGARSRPL